MFPTSLIENPTNYRFEGQDGDEDILLLVRAHPITNLGWILWAVVVFFLPFLAPAVVSLFGFDLAVIPEKYLLAFSVIDYLLVLVIVFEGFLGWYFNVSILTNKRVLDIDFHSTLAKDVDIALLQDVQEAKTSMGGVWGLIFNYGDVAVQTAAAKVEVDAKSVPQPNLVADRIMDAAERVGI
ncbi:MAG: hypothetical protein HYW45_01970 [Candidatus Daviesbacteria bacterium]|nr:MAG: hypothetical protein HYW45_01970 [Candidatus Daviesbacteria bacterium]